MASPEQYGVEIWLGIRSAVRSLKLIEKHHLQPDCILVDGYVFLDGIAEAGLGKHLYDALGGRVAVIGVAKKRYKEIDPRFEVRRGRSRRPLYVTAVGMEVDEARGHILSMHGRNRLPTLIQRADQICRGIGEESSPGGSKPASLPLNANAERTNP